MFRGAFLETPRPASPEKRSFGTTCWSLVLAAGASANPRSREAMSQLCETYWYPLYAYVRRSGCQVEDALDLTQAFFARLLEKKTISDADPQRGRFRSYLLGALKQFLTDEWDRAGRQKRGGDRSIQSLDQKVAEGRYSGEPVDERSPQQLFDRRWGLTILDLALAELRSEFIADKKGKLFEGLKPYLGGDDPRVSYAQIAATLEMNEGAIKTAVHRMRVRYRELVRRQIGQTVESRADVEDEIRHLFSVIRA